LNHQDTKSTSHTKKSSLEKSNKKSLVLLGVLGPWLKPFGDVHHGIQKTGRKRQDYRNHPLQQLRYKGISTVIPEC